MVNKLKIKGILSSLLIILFLIVTITGIGLFISPSGKVAKSTNWSFLTLDKFQLENLHTLTGFIFSFLVIIHFAFNYKMFKTEISLFKRKNKS